MIKYTMKDEDMLKLLLAFVLGFMVCKVSGAGKLVEGDCNCGGGNCPHAS